jgi:hypothetical protein
VIDTAIQDGVHSGRPRAETTAACITAYKDCKAERITATEAMEKGGLESDNVL